MANSLVRHNIEVRKSSIHGYGVFATSNITTGQIIEECYLLPCQYADEYLNNYYFQFDKSHYLLALGYGSIYNHSKMNNAIYKLNNSGDLLTFIAKRNIEKDEEIFVDYGDRWFSSRKMAVKEFTSLRKRLVKLCVRFIFICGLLTTIYHLCVKF